MNNLCLGFLNLYSLCFSDNIKKNYKLFCFVCFIHSLNNKKKLPKIGLLLVLPKDPSSKNLLS